MTSNANRYPSFHPLALGPATFNTSIPCSATKWTTTRDNPLINLPPFGGDADPRDLLLDALQTGDVNAMGTIANLQLYLKPQASRDETDINRIAWNYVGCQHGADCSGYGPATITNCGPNQVNCPPVPDQLMKMANYNWAPAQEKVDQINAALNAKQWDKLPGFTLTGG
jgi:hypothetical protein